MMNAIHLKLSFRWIWKCISAFFLHFWGEKMQLYCFTDFHLEAHWAKPAALQLLILLFSSIPSSHNFLPFYLIHWLRPSRFIVLSIMLGIFCFSTISPSISLCVLASPSPHLFGSRSTPHPPLFLVWTVS